MTVIQRPDARDIAQVVTNIITRRFVQIPQTPESKHVNPSTEFFGGCSQEVGGHYDASIQCKPDKLSIILQDSTGNNKDVYQAIQTALSEYGISCTPDATGDLKLVFQY